MLDLTSFATVGGVAAFVMILMQFVKQPLTKNSQYDWLVPWIAVGLGIITSLFVSWGLGRLNTPEMIVSAVLVGVLGGAGSVGMYEATLDKMLPNTPA